MSAEQAARHRVYRLPRWVLYVGLAGIVWPLVLVYAGDVLNDAADAHGPHEAAALLIAIIALFELLALWLVAAYCRESLTINGSTLTQRRVFGSTTIELTEVTRIDWRPGALGATRLRAGDRRVSIYLQSMSMAEQAEVIALLRGMIAPAAQQGWSERPVPAPHADPATRRMRRIVVAVFACVMFGSFSGLCLSTWASAELARQWAAIGVALGAASLCCLHRVWHLIRSPAQPR